MKTVFAGKSDVGRRRTNNEDFLILDESSGLFLVLDGMGGHLAGEVASRMGGETIQEAFISSLTSQDMDSTVLLTKNGKEMNRLASKLVMSIKKANNVIYHAQKNDPGKHGMGTTVVAITPDHEGNCVIVANVGDSRIYLIRGNHIIQVSEEHSFVMEQVRHGLITLEEAKVSQMRHMLTRVLGSEENVEVFSREILAQSGDVYLLCSDGLTDVVENEEMAMVVNAGQDDLETACQSLIDMANGRGGPDNTTVALIKIEDVAERPKEGILKRLGDRLFTGKH
ncbi:MAG: serine/threonine-protein phosphatase [Deltaproteobacteria bacterium]|nr:serine/threonine-protein phosphatase [Deltaproteobacteria bacterium]